MKVSAGLLMYRITSVLEVFLVHPGGPYFKKKDKGWWTIPKGLPEANEELLATAKREFEEETGIKSTEPYYDLGEVKQKGGKWVRAWAFSGSWREEDGISCNTFTLEWPPKSGKTAEFPEVDKAKWFTIEEARTHINEAQAQFIDRLQVILDQGFKI